jgi:hypothetical protein
MHHRYFSAGRNLHDAANIAGSDDVGRSPLNVEYLPVT